jgi:hypothetical protein
MDNPAIIISSSPILSHPSTAIIEETIASVRYHWPTAPIYVMQDGVRSEQQDKKQQYTEYCNRLQSLNLENVTIYRYPEFLHQAWMTALTLPFVKEKLMLFVEHDTPLVDAPIDWDMLGHELISENVNHIRLHYDETIHPDHQYLMRGYLTPNLIKSLQWHQRPHLARTDWYLWMLKTYFDSTSRTFIEDRIYSPPTFEPWEKWRLAIYDPNGNGRDMKRSRDLDGRSGEQKYEMIFSAAEK